MVKNKDYIAGFTKIELERLWIAESSPTTKVKKTQKGNIITKETRTKI
jgi:hypothetical protein